MKDLNLTYSVNFNKDISIERAIDEWVLKWCEKYHPEAFVEAKKYLKQGDDATPPPIQTPNEHDEDN